MTQMKKFGLPLAVWMVAALAGAQTTSTAAPPCAAPVPAVANSARVLTEGSIEARTNLAGYSAAPHNAVDLGIASPDVQLDRMLLLLQGSAAQRKALDSTLDNLQTAGNCAYHHWLTAAQFADSFSISAADAETVAAWLRTLGFTVAALPAGRGWIEFSGTAGQVEQAFGAAVHAYAVGDETRYAMPGAISIPASMAPVVQGLVSLDGTKSLVAGTAPETLAGGGMGAAESAGAGSMTPKVVGQLLHFSAEASAGAGQTIAIPTRSNIASGDVEAFRAAFGLPANNLTVQALGTDPGLTPDQSTTTMMASWAGVTAPKAQLLVLPAASTAATDGFDLALAAAVDGKLTGTIVVGNTICEPALSSAHQAFYEAVYRQAAAEGISVIAAAGDAGAAACDALTAGSSVKSGYAVNALASTPWNTAVGAIAAGDGLQAWSSTTRAGGGGVSGTEPLPAWQPALSGQANGRLLPDVALPTAVDDVANQGVAYCFGSTASQTGCTAVRGGGSAAAAAMLAGVSAQLAQKYGAQGNLAPRLYALRSESGVFEDVQSGAAKLPCASGTPDCDASGSMGYEAAEGYDLASGLGSVNIDKLVSAWASPQATGTAAVTVTLTVSPTVANATYNPSAQITFTASVASSTGGTMPTGTVQFYDNTTATNLGSAVTLGSNGTATLPITSGLAIGGNNIVAIYSGDTNYASLTSAPVTVTSQPSTTSMTITPSTTTPAVGQSVTATVTLTIGNPPAGSVAPSGKVTLNLDGLANSTAPLTTTSGTTTAVFTVTISTGGSHNLQAIYPGDANYNASTSPAVSLATAKGATTTTVTATPAILTPGTAETLTATVAPAVTTTGTVTITGTVSFFDGATLLGTAPLASNVATLSNVSLSAATGHQITAVYSGDTNWTTSTSAVLALTSNLLPDTVTLTANPTTSGPGQVITFTATVTPTSVPASNIEQNPTGNVSFFVGTTLIGTAALAAAPGNASVATLASATLPAGQDVITAVYAGDSYFAVGTSNTVSVTVQDFGLAPSTSNPPTNLTIIKGQSGTASFVVSGLGGFNGQIQVVCNVPTQDDMACTPSPQQVTPTANVMFTIQTYASGSPASAALHTGPPLWLRRTGGTALAVLAVFLLPMGRRVRRLNARMRRFLVLVLLLAGLCGGGMGCQSVSGNVASAQGTPLGVSTLTITATSYVNNAVVSHSVYLTVNVVQQ